MVNCRRMYETVAMVRPNLGFLNSMVVRLVLIAALPIAVLTLTGVGMYRGVVRPRVFALVERDLETANRAQSILIENWLYAQQRLVRYVTQWPETRSFNEGALRPRAKGLTAAVPDLFAVVLADQSGHVVMDSRSGGGGFVGTRDYFRDAMMGQSVVSGVLRTRQAGNSYVILAEPVFRGGNTGTAETVVGVVFAPVRPDSLVTLMEQDFGNPAIRSFVVDGSGRIVAGTSTGEVFFRQAADSMHRQVEQYRDFAGRSVLGVHQVLDALGWRVVSEIPLEQVTSSFTRYNRLLFVAVTLSLVVAILMAVAGAATVQIPVSRLMELTATIMDGDSDKGPPATVRPSVYTPAELNRLFHALTDLAATVRARTAELVDANRLLENTQGMAHLGSWELDTASGRIRCSSEALSILGLPEDSREVSVATVLRLLPGPQRRRLVALVRAALREQAPGVELEHPVVRADTGATRQVFQRCLFLPGEKNAAPLARGMIHDITERHAAETSLNRALAEKTTLLQEVHHRVRNNLTVMDSILSLKRASVESGSEAEVALGETQGRLRSIARVHDQLYRSTDFSSVHMRDYLAAVTEGVRETYYRSDIDVQGRFAPVRIDVTAGIPCGMIMNELLVNAFKYAFPNQGGSITVSLKPREDGWFELSVVDTGVGCPDSPDHGLGWELVHQLARQIQGSVTIDCDEGTSVRVRFPYPAG